MITFFEVLKAIIIGQVFSGFVVGASYMGMYRYNDEIRAWWTAKRYAIYYIIMAVISTGVMLVFYYNVS